MKDDIAEIVLEFLDNHAYSSIKLDADEDLSPDGLSAKIKRAKMPYDDDRSELLSSDKERFKSAEFYKTIRLLKQIAPSQDAASILMHEDLIESLNNIEHVTPRSIDDHMHELDRLKKLITSTPCEFLTNVVQKIVDLRNDMYRISDEYMDYHSTLVCQYDHFSYLKKESNSTIGLLKDKFDFLSVEDCTLDSGRILSMLSTIEIDGLSALEVEALNNLKSQLAIEQQIHECETEFTSFKDKLPFALRDLDYVNYSPEYLFGEVICKEILLNPKIIAHQYVSSVFDIMVYQGLITTPNVLITCLDFYSVYMQEDLNKIISILGRNNCSLLSKIASVQVESSYCYTERLLTIDHKNLTQIIDKLAAITGKEFQEIVSEFLEYAPDYPSLLALQFLLLQNRIISKAMWKQADEVFSSLNTLYRKAEVSVEEQSKVISLLYDTNQLLLSRPNSLERKQLLASYKQKALIAKGKPSLEWQILGEVMMAFAVCIFTLTLALAPSLVVGVIGVGIFAVSSRRTDASKAMLDLHDVCVAHKGLG